MIVPLPRLLIWTAFVVLPFSLLAPMGGIASWASGAAILGFFLAAVLDAVFSKKILNGVSLVFPETLRVSKGWEGPLDVTIQNTAKRKITLRAGIALPPCLESAQRDIRVSLAKGAPGSRVSWPCRAVSRGRFVLDACYLEAPSALGFWARREKRAARMEVRVFPNLGAERRDLAAFFSRQAPGPHAQRRLGKGREFEALREYLAGDGFEDIHWKATARRGRPVTKTYQIERAQEIYVVLDASRHSARLVEGRGQEPPASVLERFLTAALVLGLAAERQGDRFGALAFSDRVARFARAGSGKAHLGACRDMLFALEPADAMPDFSELFIFIGKKIPRRALLLFLVCLDDPVTVEDFARHAAVASRRHLVLANTLRPQGAKPLFSSPEINSPDDLYWELAGHFVMSGLGETQKLLASLGIGFFLLDNERMCPQVVAQYLSVKQRQAL